MSQSDVGARSQLSLPRGSLEWAKWAAGAAVITIGYAVVIVGFVTLLCRTLEGCGEALGGYLMQGLSSLYKDGGQKAVTLSIVFYAIGCIRNRGGGLLAISVGHLAICVLIATGWLLVRVAPGAGMLLDFARARPLSMFAASLLLVTVLVLRERRTSRV